jgi:SRSO17 transposase
MTPEQLDQLGPAFAAYLDTFLFCCGDTRTFAHLHTYCRGLLSDLPRKSVEPIALAAGTPVRSLQEFLRDHVWDFAQVRERHQQRVATNLGDLLGDDLGTLGILDESGSPKKGTLTPGVQRQWCGQLGKEENCLVTVHLAVACGAYKTLLDFDLFLPESWSQDRPRCQKAGIPDDVVHRTKSVMALEQIDRALANAVSFNWIGFDEAYGKSPDFLAGLDDRGLRFVGEVPKTFSCLVERPRTPQAGRAAAELVQSHRAFTKQAWQRLRLRRQTLADQVWEVKGVRVWAMSEGRANAQPYWLLWARNRDTGEEKYFLSNASERSKFSTMLRVGFQRWNVEHCIRLSKSELGFRHYEGRKYVSLMRHLALCMIVMGFVAEQTAGLRKKKSRGDDGAGLPGAAAALRGMVGGAPGGEQPRAGTACHRVPPTAEQGSPYCTTAAA